MIRLNDDNGEFLIALKYDDDDDDNDNIKWKWWICNCIWLKFTCLKPKLTFTCSKKTKEQISIIYQDTASKDQNQTKHLKSICTACIEIIWQKIKR